VKLTADGAGIVRAVAVSVVAIALCILAMSMTESRSAFVLLAAVILLTAAAAALQVGHAVRGMHDQNDQVRSAARAAEEHYFRVLRRIVSAIENREAYTRGRSRRIGWLARRIGERMGLSEAEGHTLHMAGQVHDIGLLAVPDHILSKPSCLGTDEYRTVQRHPEFSHRILHPLSTLSGLLPAIRYHHERMNGTGYPHGLRGEEIPLTARILAVADAYDAMTHDRPHRPALPPIEALNELHRCSPSGYDPACVEALEEVLNMRKLREVHGPEATEEAPAEMTDAVR
jgi:HD-GYP domain-containing protein (c-di-GMP phosphodiesterase class II)